MGNWCGTSAEQRRREAWRKAQEEAARLRQEEAREAEKKRLGPPGRRFVSITLHNDFLYDVVITLPGAGNVAICGQDKRQVLVRFEAGEEVACFTLRREGADGRLEKLPGVGRLKSDRPIAYIDSRVTDGMKRKEDEEKERERRALRAGELERLANEEDETELERALQQLPDLDEVPVAEVVRT